MPSVVPECVRAARPAHPTPGALPCVRVAATSASGAAATTSARPVTSHVAASSSAGTTSAPRCATAAHAGEGTRQAGTAGYGQRE